MHHLWHGFWSSLHHHCCFRTFSCNSVVSDVRARISSERGWWSCLNAQSCWKHEGWKQFLLHFLYSLAVVLPLELFLADVAVLQHQGCSDCQCHSSHFLGCVYKERLRHLQKALRDGWGGGDWVVQQLHQVRGNVRLGHEGQGFARQPQEVQGGLGRPSAENQQTQGRHQPSAARKRGGEVGVAQEGRESFRSERKEG